MEIRSWIGPYRVKETLKRIKYNFEPVMDGYGCPTTRKKNYEDLGNRLQKLGNRPIVNFRISLERWRKYQGKEKE